jgi:hypothetical protein
VVVLDIIFEWIFNGLFVVWRLYCKERRKKQKNKERLRRGNKTCSNTRGKHCEGNTRVKREKGAWEGGEGRETRTDLSTQSPPGRRGRSSRERGGPSTGMVEATLFEALVPKKQKKKKNAQ